jgi:hypothetical protein
MKSTNDTNVVLERVNTRKTLRRIYICLMVNLMGCVCTTLMAGYPTAQVKTEKTTYDLGVLPKQAGVYAFNIPVFNVGFEPLKLEFKESTCGCTQVTSYDEIIQPGSSGLINAEIHPKVTDIGTSQQILTFKTNDPNVPILKFTVFYSGYQEDILISPSVINFEVSKGDLLDNGSLHIGTILIKDNWDENLKINNVRFSEPNFSFTSYDTVYTCPTGKRTHKLIYNIFINSDIPVGGINEKMILTTNHHEKSSIEIPIKGFIEPRVKIQPKSIVIRNLTAGQNIKREIKVKATDILRVGKIRLDHPWLKVNFRTF